jgi:hypothetical protein
MHVSISVADLSSNQHILYLSFIIFSNKAQLQLVIFKQKDVDWIFPSIGDFIKNSHHVIRFSTFANNFHSMKIFLAWNRFIFIICCPCIGLTPSQLCEFHTCFVYKHEYIMRLCPQDLCNKFQAWLKGLSIWLQLI